MSGYMVAIIIEGVKAFYMVNEQDPDRACAEVHRHTGSRHPAQALTPLSDDTLDHYKVLPDDPWLCFTTNPNQEANIGEGWGIHSSAFSKSDIENVGRVELHIT